MKILLTNRIAQDDMRFPRFAASIWAYFVCPCRIKGTPDLLAKLYILTLLVLNCKPLYCDVLKYTLNENQGITL